VDNLHEMARVVVATAAGGPEVLAIAEEPVAALGPDEVRIEVRAAGVNPIDWKLYSSAMGASFPMRLGFEVAGVVKEAGREAVGPAGSHCHRAQRSKGGRQPGKRWRPQRNARARRSQSCSRSDEAKRRGST
jgi:threonine dehydrogenase-like Zn-dependent dehydrogenase